MCDTEKFEKNSPMLSSTGSSLLWRNSTLTPPSPPPPRPPSKFKFSTVSCSAQISPDSSWSEFARNISGEWDGFGADFTLQGQPIELPESVVPEAFREWEVQVFDWQTKCPTLALDINDPNFLYKSIKLLPTVGCEADAATRYTVNERNIAAASAFAYSVTGSYVAVWPVNNGLELEYCLVNPNDKESRVRIFLIVREMSLESVRVFCEQWDGPFRDGDQLGGCAIRSSGFASTAKTIASDVSGSWRVVCKSASYQSAGSFVREVSGEKVSEIVREGNDLLLLPKQLFCLVREGEDGGERVFSVGWLFEPGHAVTSSCVFSSDSKLKEVTMGRETALPDV